MTSNSFLIFKFVGALSRPIFLYLHPLYYFLYSQYKKNTDRQKIVYIKNYVKQNDTVIDIGAYIGFYTNLLADLAGPTGTVYAFEPAPENYRYLVKNCAGHAHVQARQVAIGAETSDITMYASKILNVDNRTYKIKGRRKSFLVPQTSLDDFFIKLQDQKISLIKMDIQGAEYAALQGMSEILKKSKPVILMEFWPWGLQQAGSSGEKVLSFLNGYNYDVRMIDEVNGTLQEFDTVKIKKGEIDYYDILCTPKSET